MHLSAEDQARFATQYIDATYTMQDLTRIWGQASGTLYRWGFELGLNRPKPKGEVALKLDTVRAYCEQLSRERVPLLVKPGRPKLKRDVEWPMDLALWLTDLHGGRQTVSFDSAVFARRMEALAWRIQMQLATLRHRYPIGVLHVFALGDYVVGENVGRNVTLEELETYVLRQVYDIAIPALDRFTYQMLHSFQQVIVHCVKGNHGLINKYGASKSANWDTVAYYGWEADTKGVPRDRLFFDIEVTNFYKYAVVRNMTWLLVHGDQVKASGGNPFNSFAAKAQRWHTSMPRAFDAVAAGHFHSFAKLNDVWIGPTLLSDDDWSREVLGKEGDCGQLLLGITDQGVEYSTMIGLRDVQ